MLADSSAGSPPQTRISSCAYKQRRRERVVFPLRYPDTAPQKGTSGAISVRNLLESSHPRNRLFLLASNNTHPVGTPRTCPRNPNPQRQALALGLRVSCGFEILAAAKPSARLPSALCEREWEGVKGREWEEPHRVLQCRTSYLSSAPVRMKGLVSLVASCLGRICEVDLSEHAEHLLARGRRWVEAQRLIGRKVAKGPQFFCGRDVGEEGR